MNKIFNIINKKEIPSTPPIWIMRQAGRYLPEYREIRSGVSNFLDLCYNSQLASEVTLQPIRRFDFDAAIIFSDILVIPHALGVDVKFVKNEGPVLQKTSSLDDLKKMQVDNVEKHLQPIFSTLELTKKQLAADKTLIGFSGSPWTLACYMVEGGGSKNFDLVKRAALENEEFFSKLIEILTVSVARYLIAQINHGADVVKLFDSWAGVLCEKDFQKWVIEPTKKIIAQVKKVHPNVPIIAFPRGCGTLYENFAAQVDCDVLAIDQNLSKKFVVDILQNKHNKIIQGNMDNQLLAFGSKVAIKKEVEEILEKFGKKPFIFNLGHGILPETPIENVELVVRTVRGL